MSFNAESTHPYIMNSRIKGASGTGGIGNIPIASSNTVGGIMIGDGVSIDAEGAISGVAYSTTEHKTGRKWVDGSDIYEKTFYFENGITFDISGIIVEENTNVNLIINTWASDGIHGYAPAQGSVEVGNLKIFAITRTLANIKYVTYQYTKTTP